MARSGPRSEDECVKSNLRPIFQLSEVVVVLAVDVLKLSAEDHIDSGGFVPGR